MNLRKNILVILSVVEAMFGLPWIAASSNPWIPVFFLTFGWLFVFITVINFIGSGNRNTSGNYSPSGFLTNNAYIAANEINRNVAQINQNQQIQQSQNTLDK